MIVPSSPIHVSMDLLLWPQHLEKTKELLRPSRVNVIEGIDPEGHCTKQGQSTGSEQQDPAKDLNSVSLAKDCPVVWEGLYPAS